MRLPCALPVLFVAFAALPSAAASQSSSADFRDEVQRQFEASARKIVALSQAMPENAYAWRPMEGVASVGEVYMHIARYNHMYPDENLGIAGPVASEEYGSWESDITAKADVVRVLTASVEHVRSVMSGMSEGDLDEQTVLYGRDVASWAVLLQLVTHMNDAQHVSNPYSPSTPLSLPTWM